MNNPTQNVSAFTSPDAPSIINRATPFHPGEQAVQITAGVRDEAEARGQKMLTPQLVDAQRVFFAQLSFAVSSQLDDNGQPWANLITGKPGFIQATPDGRVRIERGGLTRPAAFDASFTNLQPGSQVGLLGIEFARRRRNRINGSVQEVGDDFVSLNIDQGYGNCPKYITKRPWDEALFEGRYRERRSAGLTDVAGRIIEQTDTFFIASSSGPNRSEEGVKPQAWGSDISHRGGEPGFLERDGNTLYFDDYPGNNMFNTLGNLKAYPPCGLIILDFVSGDVVQIAGLAELLHDGERYRVAVRVTEVVHWEKTADQTAC